MTMIITDHACQRYAERVRPCTQDEARTAMSSAFIQTAIAFGARIIRLGGGQRLIIRNKVIVTVVPADRSRAQLDRMSRGIVNG